MKIIIDALLSVNEVEGEWRELYAAVRDHPEEAKRLRKLLPALRNIKEDIESIIFNIEYALDSED